jgi:guanylate kinase
MDKINLENPIVCLITGPAGAGKSTVSHALAERFEKSAVVTVDSLRNSIIGGKVKPWPHSEEVDRQMALAAKNACLLANNFWDSGFSVIIDDVIGRKLLNQYKDSFPNIKTFLLLPSVDALLNRFDNRGDNTDLRKRTEELYQKFTSRKDELDWVVIDSSNQTVEETADFIFNELNR